MALSPATIEREWSFSRAWLYDALTGGATASGPYAAHSAMASSFAGPRINGTAPIANHGACLDRQSRPPPETSQRDSIEMRDSVPGRCVTSIRRCTGARCG